MFVTIFLWLILFITAAVVYYGVNYFIASMLAECDFELLAALWIIGSVIVGAAASISALAYAIVWLVRSMS